MTTLAVLAHHDPQGLVAPHVHHLLEQLRSTVDRVVLASTDYLGPDAVAGLGGVDLLHSDGHNAFAAWSHAVGDPSGLRDLTRLLLVDHTLVGPTRPLEQVLPPVPRGVRSLVAAPGGGDHLDHRLLDLGADLLADPRTAAFFTGVRTRAGRPGADHRLAVDLGRYASTAGYPVAVVFGPDAVDRVAVGALELRAGPRPEDTSTRAWAQGVLARRGAPREAWDLPWSAVRQGRLPFVPLDRLRLLGRRSLDALVERFPDAFRGVPAYLERTALLTPGLRAATRRS